MKHIITNIILSFLLFLGSSKSIFGQESIKMHYLGNSEKPYPTLLFSHSENIDTLKESFFIHKFLITKKEFESICFIVMECNIEQQSPVISDLYEFVIVRNGNQKSYRTRNLASIKKIFNDVISQLDTVDRYKYIKGYFEQTIRRFGYQLN